MNFQTINPATEEIICEYEEYSTNKIEEIIQNSETAYLKWKRTSLAERSKLMLNAADILINRKREFAELMALEMGKPILQGIAEIEKCASCCRYYAENAEQQLKDIHINTDFKKSYVSFQPIGIVLAIMPWNFPFWQVFRFAAPTLMAGNAGLLKHARNTMGCAIKIEDIFAEAGFPEHLFSNLVIGSSLVKKVIEHPLVSAVTLTGSTPVGAEVASLAGSLIKKTVMELGGSDPYIILKDADLGKAAESCVNARLINSGQSCIAAKRFIVVESVYEQFESLFSQKMKSKIMGNPLDENVHIGPQARQDLRKELHQQVETSVKLGGKLLLGGYIPEGKGYFYPATIISNAQKGMPVYEEETFGPVAAIIKAKNETDAIEIANSTSFGLGAAIYSQNIEKAERIARNELFAGTCYVNDFVRSDSRLPFGGIKESGNGRELSEFGIFFPELEKEVGKNLDPFDLICHIAFDAPPLTRKERAENVRKRNYFAKYGTNAKQILESLLDKYADEGIENIENMDVLKVQPFSVIATPMEIVKDFFGGKDKYLEAIKELEYELYKTA